MTLQQTPLIRVDMRKVQAEFARMARGEIPLDADYLTELIECDDPGVTFTITIKQEPAVCPDCGAPLLRVECPECRVTGAGQACFMCGGAGAWLECRRCRG